MFNESDYFDFEPRFDSELSLYYHNFSARLAVGEGLKPEECRCNGGGWILSEVDTWHQCPDHFNGQRHPEDDEPEYWPEEVEAAPAVEAAPVYELTEDDVPF